MTILNIGIMYLKIILFLLLILFKQNSYSEDLLLSENLSSPQNLKILFSTPQSPIDSISHFNEESIKLNVILAISFRNQTDIDNYSFGGSNEIMSLDKIMNATKVQFGTNSCSASTGNQIRPAFGKSYLTNDGDELWLQWEAYWDKSYDFEDLGGFNTHKAFQLADGSVKDNKGSGNLKFEITVSYSRTDGTATCIPTFRTYQGASTDGSSDGVLREYVPSWQGDYNSQPGGDTFIDIRHPSEHGSIDHLAELDKNKNNNFRNNGFIIRSGKWVRFTIKFMKKGTEERVIIWMADEETDPVKVLGNINNDETGYKVDYSDEEGFNQFWFEWNSSQTRTQEGNLISYFRNLIVSEKEISLGGRPTK